MEKARLSRSCIYVCSRDIYPSITFVLSCWCCMYQNPCPPTGCRYPIWKRSAHFHSRNGGCESDKLALHRPQKTCWPQTRNCKPQRRCYNVLSTKYLTTSQNGKQDFFFFVGLQENCLFTIKMSQLVAGRDREFVDQFAAVFMKLKQKTSAE